MLQDFPSIGLSSKEALARLKQYGPNALPTSEQRTYLKILWEIMREPTFFLLLLATILYLLFGSLHEALALGTFVFLIIIITFYQQGKAQSALKTLRDLTSPRALVIRDGQAIRISGREVVPGDIVYINEGDRIPADGILISSNDLQIDESLFSGESIPVYKDFSNKEHNLVFSGTMVVQGQGILKVSATGINTTIGHIGASLQSLETEVSPLQKQTEKLIKIFTVLAITASLLLVFMLGYFEGNWLQASLAGIALAMSLLPEELPVILTLFPALGAWRLSKNNILTRRLSAIETLGAISVLCVDKTGTITENKMAATQLWVNNAFFDVIYNANFSLPEDFHLLVEYAILASEIEPFDPMEKAFHALGNHFLAQTEHLHPHWTLVKEYDRTSDLAAKTHIWNNNNNNHYAVAIKGAPEAVIQLCHLHDEEIKKNIIAAVEKMASDGLRVLAVARTTWPNDAWPTTQKTFQFDFLGIIGLTDPIRHGIQEAVKQCHHAGIKVIMVTGDYPETARFIAKQAGLPEQTLLTGSALNTMDDDVLQEKMKAASICARITPEQKLRIVEAVKKQNHIVAMTGDGVNDAPALKSAHVGIAMGMRGTDVAREAAALVLTDDNFSSIVGAIKLGRNIFDNIKKATSYIVAIHVLIAGMALLPALFGWPALFYPIHIVFLQLIIDPVCAISFENEPPESGLMERQPRRADLPLINQKRIIYSLLQGAGILLIIFITYHITLQTMPTSEARAFTFVSLIIANLSLIYWERTDAHSALSTQLLSNKILLSITLGTLICLLAIVYTDFFANLFQFSSLSGAKLFISFLVGSSSALWFAAINLIYGVTRVTE